MKQLLSGHRKTYWQILLMICTFGFALLGCSPQAKVESPASSIQSQPNEMVATPLLTTEEIPVSLAMLNSHRYSPTESASYGIQATAFDQTWATVLVFEVSAVNPDQEKFLSESGLLLNVPDAFPSSNEKLEILGGVFVDSAGVSGNFVAVISPETKTVLFVQELSSNSSLVFFREYDHSYLIGAHFYTNFQWRLLMVDNHFELIDIDAEE